MSRINTDVLFMAWAQMVALRGTCLRAQVGCVIVQDRRPIAAGYVGSRPGMPHCLDVGCEIGPDGGCIRTTHAEANAIAFAAKKGLRLQGTDLYTTHSPCRSCAQLIISAGIANIYFKEPYRDQTGGEMLRESMVGMRLVQSKPFDHPFMGFQADNCLICSHQYYEHSG